MRARWPADLHELACVVTLATLVVMLGWYPAWWVLYAIGWWRP